MRRMVALAWKEWRESRWLLAAGLGVFLALPLIGDWQARLAGQQRLMPLASITVLLLGPAFAVLLAVSAVGRDLAGRVGDFWRSRPVGVRSWLGVKFAVGLAEAVGVLGLALAVEVWRVRGRAETDSFARELLGWAPFLWVGLYAAGFAVACWVRRPAHAAAVGAAAVVLVCFGPAVLPPLERVSLPWLMEQAAAASRWTDARSTPAPSRAYALPFAATMVGLAVASFASGAWAVRRGREARTGPRLMFGAVGAVLLALVGSAAVQYGNNLPVLQTIPLDAGDRVVAVRSGGGRGMIAIDHDRSAPGQPRPWRAGMLGPPTLRSFEVTAAGVALGPPVTLSPALGVVRYDDRGGWGPLVAWDAGRPGVAYVVAAGRGERRMQYRLLAVSLAPAAGTDPVLGSVELFPDGPPDDPEELRAAIPTGIRLTVSGRWLYAYRFYESQVFVDVGDPRQPTRVPGEPARRVYGFGRREDGRVEQPLRTVPGIPAADALRLNLPEVRDGVWCGRTGDGLRRRFVLRRLATLEEAIPRLEPAGDVEFGPFAFEVPQYLAWATFEPAGEYEVPFLGRLLGWGEGEGTFGEGFAYTSASLYGPRRESVKAVDFRDPSHPRAAGHFVLPTDLPWSEPLLVAPLPGGRALVGGTSLLVLGPVRR